MTKSKSSPVSSGFRNQLAAVEQRLGPIQYRPIECLKAYANNPRKHPEKQLVKLGASIAEFGFAFPVLIDDGDTIIAGEARVAAAKRLNMRELPVVVAHQWSPAQVRAYRLADNRLAELATWDREALALELTSIVEFEDFSIELLGWDTGEVDLILEGADQAQDGDPLDDLIEPPSVPVSRAGDLWVLGTHRLLCGSSLDATCWSALLAQEQAAMAFTDPPYNVKVAGHVSGLGQASHDEFAMASGEMSKAQFTKFLTDFIRGMSAGLKDGAVVDLCIDWRHMGEMLAAIEANSLSLINVCAWNKTNGGMGSLYRSKHELIFIAKKGNAPHTNNVELGKNGRYRTNVWDYAGVNTFGKGRAADLADHPTVKPIALVADAIRDVTHPGEIVLDAFMGSGTTILAAERTKRRARGVEIAPGYVDVAIRRWEAMTGLDALLESSGQSFAQVSDARAEPADVAAGQPESRAHLTHRHG